MDRAWRDGRDGRGSYKRPFAAVAQSDYRPIQDYSEEELREILEARSLDSNRRRERQREKVASAAAGALPPWGSRALRAVSPTTITGISPAAAMEAARPTTPRRSICPFPSLWRWLL
jgi:hypothetical protein